MPTRQQAQHDRTAQQLRTKDNAAFEQIARQDRDERRIAALHRYDRP